MKLCPNTKSRPLNTILIISGRYDVINFFEKLFFLFLAIYGLSRKKKKGIVTCYQLIIKIKTIHGPQSTYFDFIQSKIWPFSSTGSKKHSFDHFWLHGNFLTSDNVLWKINYSWTFVSTSETSYNQPFSLKYHSFQKT